MSRVIHAIIVLSLLVPIIYFNVTPSGKEDIKKVVEINESKAPNYVGLFPLERLANKDFVKAHNNILQIIQKVKLEESSDSRIIVLLHKYSSLLETSIKINPKEQLLKLQNSVVEFDLWQRAKKYKSIDHYIMQIKNLIPLYGRSLFYIQSNYLNQIKNLVIDIKNSSFSNPSIQRADKERILRLIDPILDNINGMKVLEDLSKDVISTRDKINVLVDQIVTTSEIVTNGSDKNNIKNSNSSFIKTRRAQMVATFYLVLLLLSYVSWVIFGQKFIFRSKKQSIKPVIDIPVEIQQEETIIVAAKQLFDINQVLKKVLNDIVESSIDSGVGLTFVGVTPIMISGERQQAYNIMRKLILSLVSYVAKYSLHKNIKVILKQEFDEVLFEARYIGSNEELKILPLKVALSSIESNLGTIRTKNLYGDSGELVFSGITLNIATDQSSLSLSHH